MDHPPPIFSISCTMARTTIDKLKAIKASVAIFIFTFFTYQAAPYLFGSNWQQYMNSVQYYALITMFAFVMFYARTEKTIPTQGEWFPLRRIGFLEFGKDFMIASIFSIIIIGAFKWLIGEPLVSNPNGLTLYALIDYSLIVAIHENLVWLVMLPPFMAISTWRTQWGRFLNSIPVCGFAALFHAPKIYGEIMMGSQGSGVLASVVVSVVIIWIAFMVLFYVTHTFGFAPGVALHAWWNIMI